jgi:hypothetical protein
MKATLSAYITQYKVEKDVSNNKHFVFCGFLEIIVQLDQSRITKQKVKVWTK